MTAPHDTVRVHYQGLTLAFRVEGRGTMTQCLPFRRCAEQALATGAEVLHVDLSHCVYMDSTFIGTLIALKRTIDRRGHGQFALASPSPQCRDILRVMGVDQFLPTVPAEEPAGDGWVDLDAAPNDVNAYRRNVVAAHQELASLPGPAGECFREVARGLTESMEEGEGGR